MQKYLLLVLPVGVAAVLRHGQDGQPEIGQAPAQTGSSAEKDSQTNETSRLTKIHFKSLVGTAIKRKKQIQKNYTKRW